MQLFAALVPDCADTPRGALDSFIVVMAWGYGMTGYGVHRTAEILADAGADAGPKLARARRIVVREGPLSGYEWLADRGRLHGLGPAFGTKYLFFHNEDALILDRWLADWYRAVTGVDLRPTVWNLASYSEYLDQVGEWSAAAGVDAVRFEETVFTLIAALNGGQWDPEAGS